MRDYVVALATGYEAYSARRSCRAWNERKRRAVGIECKVRDGRAIPHVRIKTGERPQIVTHVECAGASTSTTKRLERDGIVVRGKVERSGERPHRDRLNSNGRIDGASSPKGGRQFVKNYSIP